MGAYLFISANRIYYFRKRFSLAASRLLERADLRISLRTTSVQIARRRALRMLQLVERIEVRCALAKKSNSDLIQQELNEYIADQISLYRAMWARGELPFDPEDDLTPLELELDELRGILRGHEPWPSHTEAAEQSFRKRLHEAKGVPEDELQDFPLRYLEARSAALAYGSLLQKGAPEETRLKAVQHYFPGFRQPKPETHLPQQREAGPRISELRDKFQAERARAGLEERSIKATTVAINYFIELCGDLPIEEVDRATARSFKEKYSLYPKNKNKMPATKDLSFEEIQKSGIEYEPISTTTVNNNLTKLSTFFNWAHDHGYAKENPIAKMKIKESKREKDDRFPFTDLELQRLFDPKVHNFKALRRESYFWAPLIALYTGGRVNEICQLYLDDIEVVDGIDVIHFRSDRLDQKLKNPASIRQVPIHRELLEIGFLEFVNSQRERGEQRLFPDLKLTEQGYSGNFSKWFGRRKEAFISQDRRQKVTFHPSATHSPTIYETFVRGLTRSTACRDENLILCPMTAMAQI